MLVFSDVVDVPGGYVFLKVELYELRDRNFPLVRCDVSLEPFDKFLQCFRGFSCSRVDEVYVFPLYHFAP